MCHKSFPTGQALGMHTRCHGEERGGDAVVFVDGVLNDEGTGNRPQPAGDIEAWKRQWGSFGRRSSPLSLLGGFCFVGGYY